MKTQIKQISKKKSSGLKFLQKPISITLILLTLSFPIVMTVTANPFSVYLKKNPNNSICLPTVTYHGQVIPSVTLSEVSIVANAVHNSKSKDRSRVAGEVNYNGQIVLSINLPAVEIKAARKK